MVHIAAEEHIEELLAEEHIEEAGQRAEEHIEEAGQRAKEHIEELLAGLLRQLLCIL